MEFLRHLYGWPHEALHVLALWLIGRRPRRVNRLYVDIPDDLTTRQYVFVAGLPALVFGLAALLGLLVFVRASTFGEAALGLLVMLVMGVGAAGTVGDLEQIALRLMQARESQSLMDEPTDDEEKHG